MKWKNFFFSFLFLFAISAYAIDDYYRILGVSPSASSEEIKKAYRIRAMKYHPDRNGGSVTSTKIFQKINEANDVLSDPVKKAKYDSLIKVKASPRAATSTTPQGEVKKYQWQTFNDTETKAQPKAQTASPKAEPKPEVKPQPTAEVKVQVQSAPETKVSVKEEAIVPIQEKAPAKTIDPRMKMYNTPSCGRGFLGTVIDVLI
jgi:curved DNA-binding protein CbpA